MTTIIMTFILIAYLLIALGMLLTGTRTPSKDLQKKLLWVGLIFLVVFVSSAFGY